MAASKQESIKDSAVTYTVSQALIHIQLQMLMMKSRFKSKLAIRIMEMVCNYNQFIYNTANFHQYCMLWIFYFLVLTSSRIMKQFYQIHNISAMKQNVVEPPAEGKGALPGGIKRHSILGRWGEKETFKIKPLDLYLPFPKGRYAIWRKILTIQVMNSLSLATSAYGCLHPTQKWF